MKVTYIKHSGFLVELTSCVLLFDYYQGDIPKQDRDKPFYVFVSHRHQDHFNMDIFKLADYYEQVYFILSYDIKLNDRYLEKHHIAPAVRERIIKMNRHTAADSNHMKIETLASTDEGVAFLVSTEGRTIYHAGDLHWWHWEGEPDAWNQKMEKMYTSEINRIKGRHIDCAFLPVDPRLKEAYYLGIRYFLNNTDTAAAFPMHFWEDYTIIKALLERKDMSSFQDKIVILTKEGQSFTL